MTTGMEWLSMMFGKHFASMYEGSMVGAGSHIFAVMGYVIAKMVPDRKVGAQVELNPRVMAFLIGDTEERMREAIGYLCREDEESRTKTKGGRRLIKLGEYDYQVVNGPKYMKIRNEEERRIQNREAKQRERERKKGKPLVGEEAFERASERGEDVTAKSDEYLPSGVQDLETQDPGQCGPGPEVP
jgi:hypothetical protein